MKNKCPKCKRKSEVSQRFCIYCGTPIPQKKKKKAPIALIVTVSVLAAVIGIAALIWFAFGNMLTLFIHTNSDLAVFNSGSLDVPGAAYSDHSELPDYVVEMLGEDPDAPEYGPVLTAILPRLQIERTKINGFFGGNTVEYRITAPDLENWLLTLDMEKQYTSELLSAEMLSYIETAPLRTQTVVIEYQRDGLFGWQGNYMSAEFADAISGGINSAYSELYFRMTDELEEFLK